MNEWQECFAIPENKRSDKDIGKLLESMYCRWQKNMREYNLRPGSYISVSIDTNNWIMNMKCYVFPKEINK